MGVTIATLANNHVCLAPSDSTTETAFQRVHFTDPSQPQAVRDLWAGCFYRNLDLPVGANPTDYKFVDPAIVKISTITTGADGLNNLKNAARSIHDYYNSLSDRLEGREAQFWHKSTVDKAHDILAEMHRATYIIIGRHVPSVATLTIAQRLAYCQQVGLGPTDIRHLNPLTQVNERVHHIYEILSVSSFAAPTAPFTYVDPRGVPAPVKLVDSASLSGTGTYTDSEGAAGTGLGLNTVTSFVGINIDGDWIDDLTG